MKKSTKTFIALFSACLWVLMLACHFTPKRPVYDIDTTAWFPNHSEIQKDTTNWLIEPRFIDND